MSRKVFASQADLEDKRISFVELAEGAYAYTAEGDPNAGVIVGDDAVMVIDTLATPIMARDLIERIRTVTDKPVKYIVLTHYHAVRVLGASAYGAEHIIASQPTYELIRERGEADYKSEYERFPRLFRGAESIPGLTQPTLVFDHRLTLWLGRREVRIMHLGKGHTKGDTVVWLPEDKVLYSGDLVEFGATPYAGDAYFREWPRTLERLRELKPEQLVPGRGDALRTPRDVEAALAGTGAFVTELYQQVAAAAQAQQPLQDIYRRTHERLAPEYGHWVIFDHCMPFNVTRAYDEATGHDHPRIWTAQRDQEMWRTLEGE